MKRAVRHIHFVGTPGAGPRRLHVGWPMPAKRVVDMGVAK
jgi:hypothetical protein